MEAEVVSVKRKYFYVRRKDSSRQEKFDRETGECVCEDCNAGWTIWPSKQAYLDETERWTKLRAAAQYFRHGYAERDVDLETARQIYDILTSRGYLKPGQD